MEIDWLAGTDKHSTSSASLLLVNGKTLTDQQLNQYKYIKAAN